MKHNNGRLRTAILGPLAVAATIAVTAALSGCSSATSAQPAAAHPAAQSGCSLNPSPPSGFTEQKTSAGGIGINYVRGGHGPTLLLVVGYPQTWYAWDDILPELARHYAVVAPDLPGSGGSDAPAGTSAYTKKARRETSTSSWPSSDSTRTSGSSATTSAPWSRTPTPPRTPMTSPSSS